MAAVFAVLAGRLYQLQIRDGEEYMVDAEANRISERLVAPPRGRIIDRFGVELATNRRNYRVLLVSEQATEGVEAALDQIGKVILLSDQQKKKVMRDIAANKKFVPVPVVENLTWDEFSPRQPASALSGRGSSPMWARPATIPLAASWSISWAMSPRCRSRTSRATTIR